MSSTSRSEPGDPGGGGGGGTPILYGFFGYPAPQAGFSGVAVEGLHGPDSWGYLGQILGDLRGLLGGSWVALGILGASGRLLFCLGGFW